MNLSHSNLTSINSGAFLGMQFLLEIDLRGNSLVYVDLDVFMSATFSILVNEPYLCCYTERYVKKYCFFVKLFYACKRGCLLQQYYRKSCIHNC